LAKELKVDLSTLKGSGPHGRIVAEDVEAAANKANNPTEKRHRKNSPVAPHCTRDEASRASPLPFVHQHRRCRDWSSGASDSKMQVVQNMLAGVPTFHVGYTITTDELDKLYKQIKSKGVTMTALLAKAVALTLQKHPLLNASY